jgi:hypothetical protein
MDKIEVEIFFIAVTLFSETTKKLLSITKELENAKTLIL